MVKVSIVPIAPRVAKEGERGRERERGRGRERSISIMSDIMTHQFA